MPALVADVADDQALRDKLLQGIDTQLQATLPLEYHAAQILQRHLQIGRRRDPAFPIPLPPNKPNDEASTEEWDTYRRKLKEEWEPEFQHHALMVVTSRHFHTHQGTCTVSLPTLSVAELGSSLQTYSYPLWPPSGHSSVRDLCCQRECRREKRLRIEEREKDKRCRARR